MKPIQDFGETLEVRLPADYLKFMERYGDRLTDDPINQQGFIQGLGTSHFVMGTTLAFRTTSPKFSRHYVIIGYAGKKTIIVNKVYEEIDNYVALDTRDGKVVLMDALGTAVEAAESFLSWVTPKLQTARLNELKRITTSNLTVVIFDDELKAEEARQKLLNLQKQGFVDLEDVVVVGKGKDGTTQIHQTQEMSSKGALVGSITGLIVGSLLAMPLAGVLFGGVTGAVASWATDVGIDSDFVEELGELLNPGSSAIFTLVRSADPDKVTEEFRAFGGTVLVSSVDWERAKVLQAVLDPTGASNEHSN
jgi:uncharacterized membrane protein